MKTALITGGSSGIGFGLSRKFAKEGYRLLWVSKPEYELAKAKEKILSEFPNAEIYTLAKDLSDQSAAKEVHNWAKQIGQVDVLVNNAGFGTYGFLQDIDIHREIDMINLNVLTLYSLTRYFLDDMLKRDQGTIINISSNSSFETVPRLLTYSSTKAFVKHFSRGLSEELKMQGSKVKVITICPAAIRNTGFKKVGKMENVRTFNAGLATTTVEEVVSDIWRAFKKGKSFLITGWRMRWLYPLYGIMPFRMIMFLTKRESSEE